MQNLPIISKFFSAVISQPSSQMPRYSGWHDKYFDDSAVRDIEQSKLGRLLEEDDTNKTKKWSLVTYNCNFGGGEDVPKLYPEDKKKVDEAVVSGLGYDLALYRVVRELQRSEDGFFARNFGFALIESKYARWVAKCEYDGLEIIGFKTADYIVDTVRDFLKKNRTIGMKEWKAIEKEARAVVIYKV